MVLALAGCDRSGSGTPSAGPAAAPPAPKSPSAAADDTGLASLDGIESGIDGTGMNVVLVSVDTTRADHLGCWGHPVIKTPNIDRFAAQGTRFLWCISSAPLTLPSHTTMLTGSYPFVHGARDNGIFFVDQGNVTLAELFKEAHYATDAEVAAVVLGRRYGLDQGFDTYGDVKPNRPKMNLHDLADVGTGGDGSTKPAIEFERPVIQTDRKAGEITDRGIEIISGHAETGRPFFVFLHYFDPHWPHEAPEPFASAYDEGYYAEIAFFDQEFGRLLDAIDDLGLAGKTLVILTSDHGEGRGHHGEHTHSAFLYDSTLHVPLIMRCPGLVPAGLEVEQQVRLVDITPTIADFAGLRRTEQMQGTSLLPLLADPDRDVRLACYADTLVLQNTLNYSPLRSVRTEQWKYILAPREELYNVSQDRRELFNLASIETERAAAMRQELWDIIADAPPAPGGRGKWRAPEAEEVRKLAALGYVSGKVFQDPSLMEGTELDHFEPVGLNPRDRIEVVDCWAMGLGAFRVGDYETAEKLFRRFIELEPENAFGNSYLARVLTRLNRYEEALGYFQRSLELEPDNFLDQRMLGTVLVMAGAHAEAAESYRAALKYNPLDIVARLNLGIILANRHRFEEALEHFDIGIETLPDEPPLYFQKGLVLLAMNRPDDAVQQFREALQYDSGFVKARVQLADTLFGLGREVEARAALTEAIEATPDSALLHHKRAELDAFSGDFQRACEGFQRVVELVPANAMARQNVGSSFVSLGRYAEAIEWLREALRLRPDFLMAQVNLAAALEATGELDEAFELYETLLAARPHRGGFYTRAANVAARRGNGARAIQLLRRGYAILPDNVGIANDLAWRLATVPDDALRDGPLAVALAEYVNDLRGGESSSELDTLAAAYAAVGRFEDAVEAAERALAIARRTDQDVLAGEISQRLDLFRQRKPYRLP